MKNMELYSESDRPMMDTNENPASLARARRWMFLVLLVIPCGIMLGKLSVFPTASAFSAWFSLTDLPKHIQPHVEYIIFVPLSAVVVSFFRLTLGVPVLSLFRPILVAIAFRIIGIPLGLAFLAVVLGTVLLLRPLLKGAHYYARVPLQLSLVAIFLVLPLIAGKWWHEDWLRHLAYFPIISLCLICEAFTKSLDRKGLAEAAWPTLNTILIGMIISLVASIHGALHLLLRFPELLVAQAGLVLLIGEYLHFEILKGKNLLVRQREAHKVASLPDSYANASIGLTVELANQDN
jgi:7 transmembrane helices usually fused to an inactive transglutaminase